MLEPSSEIAEMSAHGHANFPRKTWKLRSQHASDTERRGLVQDAALPVTVVGGEQANARINSCLGECAS